VVAASCAAAFLVISGESRQGAAKILVASGRQDLAGQSLGRVRVWAEQQIHGGGRTAHSSGRHDWASSIVVMLTRVRAKEKPRSLILQCQHPLKTQPRKSSATVLPGDAPRPVIATISRIPYNADP
jgi:hypothetical protein